MKGAIHSLAGVALSLALVSTASAQTLSRPTACSTCIGNWYYFDEVATGAAGDWNCGGSSYDGHHGSDFSLIGNNGAIDTGYDIVATAAGTVVAAEDGHFDHCTACGGTGCGSSVGSGYGNHVVINEGSYKVIYGHMRTGSVRVAVGDTVSCGQVIGQIGSSGCTTGAHLHVETRPVGGAYASAFDPFQGGCSPTSPSLWTGQGPYRGLPDATCGAPPPPTCPSGTYAIWTCNAAATERTRCLSGVVSTEACSAGCISMPSGTDDVCATPPPPDCGSLSATYTCTADASARERCSSGMIETDACAAGCVASASGDASCATPPDCGSLAATYACAGDGLSRARCVSGTTEVDDCPAGCVVTAAGEDDLCRAVPDGGVQDASALDASGLDASAPDASGPDASGGDASAARDADVDGGGSVVMKGGCSCDLAHSAGSKPRLPLLALPFFVLVAFRFRRHPR